MPQPKLQPNQEVEVYNQTMNAEGLEGTGVLVRYLRTVHEIAVGGKYDGQKVEFELWRVRMGDEEKTRCFVVEDIKPKLSVEDVKRLILEQGLEIATVIDAVIELNGFVGVGLITLGENLQEYCRNKIRK